jgi:hypothetical protein
MISRFAALKRTTVSEVLEMDWDAFLRNLIIDPRCQFAGQFEQPGWAAVTFDPPARLKENVKAVHALVLDYDKSPSWDALVERWGQSFGAIYTTKSHAAQATHYRVVLPLSRSVTADEYTRIWDWGRRVSLEVGQVVDPQTKDASRFWFEPSTPGGGWRAQLFEGAFVDADAVLDLSFIDEAPKRVVETVAPASDDERMRRARAYQRKMPPAVEGDAGSRQTWNTVQAVMIGFDLSRSQAADILEEYNARCEPPWDAGDFARKLDEVAAKSKLPRGYLLTPRTQISSTEAASAAAPLLDESVNVDWTSLLKYKSDHTTPRRGFHNVVVYVRHHPNFIGRWSYNQMTSTPWIDDRPVDDTIVSKLVQFIDTCAGFSPSVGDIERAIGLAAMDRPFHPLQQHLRSLDWDGTLRLGTMAREHLGTDSALHAVLLRKWMVSCVARAMQPGCKVDAMLVLAGAQGTAKSTFFRVLGGAWYRDTTIDLQDKDRFGAVHASWVIELAELDGLMRGRDASRLKAFLSSAIDDYRAPYARNPAPHARSSVFGATTNHTEFLPDETGTRRFWVIPVTQRIDIPQLEHARDQLWAEAVAAYESGESWWLSDEDEALRAEANQEHETEDPWQEVLGAWLASSTRTSISILDALSAIGVPTEQAGIRERMRVGAALKRLGWERYRQRDGAFFTWRYRAK